MAWREHDGVLIKKKKYLISPHCCSLVWKGSLSRRMLLLCFAGMPLLRSALSTISFPFGTIDFTKLILSEKTDIATEIYSLQQELKKNIIPATEKNNHVFSCLYKERQFV
jgi:hypothetical protein